MDDLHLRSADGRFGMQISKSVLRYILEACSSAGGLETGGILIGNYARDHDIAVIAQVTGPPSDSRRGVTWFFRGIKGLQRLLRRLWSNELSYYLGEWHSHPRGRAIPSEADARQMKQIAGDNASKCPEPLLLIVGGTLESWDVRAYVFPRSEKHQELV